VEPVHILSKGLFVALFDTEKISRIFFSLIVMMNTLINSDLNCLKVNMELVGKLLYHAQA